MRNHFVTKNLTEFPKLNGISPCPSLIAPLLGHFVMVHAPPFLPSPILVPEAANFIEGLLVFNLVGYRGYTFNLYWVKQIWAHKRQRGRGEGYKILFNSNI